MLDMALGVPEALASQPCSCRPLEPSVLILQSLPTSLVSSQASCIEEILQLPFSGLPQFLPLPLSFPLSNLSLSQGPFSQMVALSSAAPGCKCLDRLSLGSLPLGSAPSIFELSSFFDLRLVRLFCVCSALLVFLC